MNLCIPQNALSQTARKSELPKSKSKTSANFKVRQRINLQVIKDNLETSVHDHLLDGL